MCAATQGGGGRLVPLLVAFNKVVLVQESHREAYAAHMARSLPPRKSTELCGVEVGVYEGGWIAAFHSNDRFE